MIKWVHRFSKHSVEAIRDSLLSFIQAEEPNSFNFIISIEHMNQLYNLIVEFVNNES